MPKYLTYSLLCLTLVCAITVSLGAEPLKSSIQPGEKITTIFEPLNINGEHAGEPHCLVCENGASPVAMLFARDLDEPLLKLLVKIDAATAKHQKEGMGSFVVFLSDSPELPKKLEVAAKKHKFKHLVLSTFEPAGPEGFEVSKEAAVTVVLYSEHTVRANHAFRKGELTDQEIERVLGNVPKILDTK
ncbi:MAG: hypothetical protein ACKVP0_23095 [Pirellulaceae bacterium]